MKGKTLKLLLFLLLAQMILIGNIVSAQGVAVGDVIGDATGVPYVVKESINNGEPITISLWDWWTPRFEYWQQVAAEYTELYPNVTFDIQRFPGDEYWTKIIAGLPAGEIPDILAFHNEQHDRFVGNALVEPYPASMFDREFLNENWIGFAEGHFDNPEGEIAYLPYGGMAAVAFVNKAMWDAAGLTDADIPNTWDEFQVVAEKLTQYDAQGRVEVAGFNVNPDVSGQVLDLMLQKGRYIFSADATACNFDSPEALETLNYLTSFYDKNIVTRDFPNWVETFGTSLSAMTVSYTWFGSFMAVNHPEIEVMTFQMPSWTGEFAPSMGTQNYDVSNVIPVTAPDDHKAVAWDFLHWLYSQDQKLVDLALVHSFAPAYKKIFNDPRILEVPAVALLTEVMEYKVFMGNRPASVNDALVQYLDGNVAAGVPNEEALAQADQACDAAMQEQQYTILERTYGNNDLMLQDP